MAEKILVVDDEHDTRETISLFLIHQGYDVQGVSNGDLAWQELQNKPFDLVVSDVMMPVMNGFELLEKIRATSTLRNLPVMMVTALNKADDIVKAFELGASDYITKPFVNVELIARTSSALRFHRLETEKSRGLELVTFKKALNQIEKEMYPVLIHLTRCASQLFKGEESPKREWTVSRKDLYDNCVKIQLVLKQLDKIKSLNT